MNEKTRVLCLVAGLLLGGCAVVMGSRTAELAPVGHVVRLAP